MIVSMGLLFYHPERGFMVAKDKDNYYQIVEETVYYEDQSPNMVILRMMMKYYRIFESFYFQRRFIKYMEKNGIQIDEEVLKEEVEYMRQKYVYENETYQEVCIMEEMFQEIFQEWFIPRRIHTYDVSKDEIGEYQMRVVILEIENIEYFNDQNTMLNYPFFYNKKLDQQYKNEYIPWFEWKRLYDIQYEESTQDLWDALDFLDVGIPL
jgi:hypothetical protein